MNTVNFLTTCPAAKPLVDPFFCPSFIEKVISLSPIAPSLFQTPPTPLDLLKKRIEAFGWAEKLRADPPLPDSHPIDWDKAEQWVQGHCTPEAQDMAKAFLTTTRHISHAQFERALQHSVSQFNRYLADKPSKEYLLVTTAAGKSNRWVGELALKYLDVLPVQVMKTTSTFALQDETIDYLRAHPEVKHIVILDDAAYSCEQIRIALYHLGQIEQREKCKDLLCSKEEYLRLRTATPTREFSAIIPFIRDPECLFMKPEIGKQLVPDMTPSINVFASQKLYRLKELLPKEQYRTFVDLHNDGIYNTARESAMIPIYYDHKIPDYMSSFPHIYESGMAFCDSAKLTFPFISSIFPPYKEISALISS